MTIISSKKSCPPIDKLEFKLIDKKIVSAVELGQMYELFNSHYEKTSYEQFTEDLSWKQYIGILCDPQGTLRGFTTFAINPITLGKLPYNVIFSGDTIIDQKFWGTQSLVKGFLRTVGSFFAGLGNKKLYWFLISKGHRTYLYLPYFFKEYYPRLENTEDSTLKFITDQLANQMFSKHWDPMSGLIKFEQNCFLKANLQGKLSNRRNNQYINFFLSKNPNFAQGEELACLAEIHPDNFRRSAKKFLQEGINNPISVDAI